MSTVWKVTIHSNAACPGKFKKDYVRMDTGAGNVEWGKFKKGALDNEFIAEVFVRPGQEFDARGSTATGQSWCKFKGDSLGIGCFKSDGTSVLPPDWLSWERATGDVPAGFVDPKQAGVRQWSGKKSKKPQRTPAMAGTKAATLATNSVVGGTKTVATPAWPFPVGECIDQIKKQHGVNWDGDALLALMLQWVEERAHPVEFCNWLESTAEAEVEAMKHYAHP